MLTAQTKDSLVAKMMPDIFRRIKRPEDLLKISRADLEKLIYPVSFYRNKAKHLQQLAKILIEKYKGKIPLTHAELIVLPGVGEKTAHIVLHRAHDTHVGIGVDVHVHRISNRLGYIRTKTPHQTEMVLQKKLPRKYWGDYNSLLVKWGQNICTPVSPRCSQCVIRKYCKRVGVRKAR
jgi:endonuclease-3